MLTLRIEHGRPDMPARRVLTCAAYDVDKTDGKGGVLVRLRIPGAGEGAPDQHQEVELSSEGTIYVMNDQGVTVDVIRGKERNRK